MNPHDSWALRQLGDLVDVLDRRRVPVSAAERAKRPGTVPYYGAAGPVGTIDEALFDEPLILLGEDGIQFFDPSKPKAYLIDGPAWVNNHSHVLRARPGVDRRWLGYFLNIADYRGYANGTTRLKLTQLAMKSIPVPIPPIEEQRRVIAILEDHLSRLDAADSYLFSALHRADLLRARVLSEIPFDDVISLAKLAVKSDYGTSVKCVVGGPGPAVVRIPNLIDGHIDLRDEKRVATSDANVSGSLLSPGDLLIVRTNGSPSLIGRSAVVQDGVEAAFASYLIRYRVDMNLVRPEWVQTILSTPSVRATLQALAASSAGQLNLSLGKLNGLMIPVPSLSTQDEVMTRIQAIEAQRREAIGVTNVAMRRSQALRRALLDAAFSGRLAGVPNPAAVVEDMIGA
ncbi:hypothetical protein GSU68_15785 [Rathayibacter sp. VKM Ac-2759]|uniref:restriction endonuclease subunit S n=1 Tax=Rathayibacter sp. VKM Ac-2759 TaxID=2609252 RepID=UPI0013161AF0|nr:restriction endonuclease subunit S [Rathayibacter sp. VKM Ac-2759]QHC67882.1 hypothetical protein GSU68_15785 [Rathayibacter sp. VKM Ac-2759]